MLGSTYNIFYVDCYKILKNKLVELYICRNTCDLKVAVVEFIDTFSGRIPLKNFEKIRNGFQLNFLYDILKKFHQVLIKQTGSLL